MWKALLRRYLKLFIAIAILIAGCERGSPIVKKTQPLMGTWVSISVYEPDIGPEKVREAIRKAFEAIEKIDSLMSAYDDQSEISRINRSGANKSLEISPDTLAVLNKSAWINKISRGAFDITIQPLIELWGFYDGGGSAIPTNEEIEEVLAFVGQNKLIIDKEYGYISKSKKDIKIDLSGIAKGFAVDAAISMLMRDDVRNALVDAGGDIYCLGSGAKNSWKVGIKHPRKNKIISTLELKNIAVATSGDYENFKTVNSQRFSHIIDPRTGYPVRNKPVSVTVLAPDCATADGLATALTVMGAEDGLALVERLDFTEAIFISQNNESLRIEVSEGLKGLYEFSE